MQALNGPLVCGGVPLWLRVGIIVFMLLITLLLYVLHPETP